jgi:hypothetical protein
MDNYATTAQHFSLKLLLQWIIIIKILVVIAAAAVAVVVVVVLVHCFTIRSFTLAMSDIYFVTSTM